MICVISFCLHIAYNALKIIVWDMNVFNSITGLWLFSSLVGQRLKCQMINPKYYNEFIKSIQKKNSTCPLSRHCNEKGYIRYLIPMVDAKAPRSFIFIKRKRQLDVNTLNFYFYFKFKCFLKFRVYICVKCYH